MIRTIQKVQGHLEPKKDCPQCHGDPNWKSKDGFCCVECMEFDAPKDVLGDLQIKPLPDGGALISFNPLEGEMNRVTITASVQVCLIDETRPGGTRFVTVKRELNQVEIPQGEMVELEDGVQRLENAKKEVVVQGARVSNIMRTVCENIKRM